MLLRRRLARECRVEFNIYEVKTSHAKKVSGRDFVNVITDNAILPKVTLNVKF